MAITKHPPPESATRVRYAYRSVLLRRRVHGLSGGMETTVGVELRSRRANSWPETDRSSSDHRFFVAAAAIALTIVVVGFGRGFLPGATPHPRPRTPLVLVHASVFAAWIVLFAVQVSLVATGRVRTHRRLGVAGVLLAGVMLVVGFAVAVHGARTGHAPVPGVSPLEFFIVPVVDLVLFAPLVGSAIYWRRKPEVHKRLMWLATANLTFAAIVRLPGVQGNQLRIFAVFLAVLLFAPIYERIVNGRMHRVSLWGGVGIFLSLPARHLVAETAAWHRFAAWLIR